MKRTIRESIAVILLLVFAFSAESKPMNSFAETNVVGKSINKLDLNDFQMSNILVTDPYEKNAYEKEITYLLKFDTNKLLANFRKTAGLDTKGAVCYNGWENSLIGGHTIGHYLTACAQAYENPASSADQKSAIFNKMKEIVDGLFECQQYTKGSKGFLFGSTLISGSTNVELQFDNVEKGLTDIFKQSWVPWYTMHKIISGLVSVYELTGYENAKTVASDLGDWTYNRTSKWSESTKRTVLGIEYGGMNDCLYELYKITGKEEHAVAAHLFDDTTLFERVLTGNVHVLNNMHANTTIPKFIGALNRYRTLNGKTIEGKVVDANSYLKYAEAFWQMVVDKHTYITGDNSEWERFGLDHVLDKERTNCNCETCNAYNMLKLARELFKITGDHKYADYYENTYYNSILSSQNPETGMTTYFQPMATGYFKVYSTPFDNFWCCTGSGMENFTKLNDSIYYNKGNTVYVNMYLSSVLTWKDKNVELKQDTDIPNSDTATFTVRTLSGNSTDMKLCLRIPDWAADEVTISVNGKKYKAEVKDNYALLNRDFANGDKITISIPMAVKAYGLSDNNTVYAFKYGPVVLSAELGSENMIKSSTGMNVAIPAAKKVASETLELTKAGQTVKDYITNINQNMVKADGKISFTLNGTKTPLVFSTHYLQYKQRYGIYWYFAANSDTNITNEPNNTTNNTINNTTSNTITNTTNDTAKKNKVTKKKNITVKKQNKMIKKKSKNKKKKSKVIKK